MGSLSRSRTSLNLITTKTPTMDRRGSVSPLRETKSATNTTKRTKLAKAQKFGSTSNLKLVSEKISGFSVFNGPNEYRRDAPIMAYGDEASANGSVKMRENVKRGPKLNRQTMSEQLLMRTETDEAMKRSLSQHSLREDRALEAVVIDLPSMDYNTGRSTSPCGTLDSRDGSEDEGTTKYFSRWGPIRGSNSYSDSPDVPISQLSTVNLRASITSKNRDDSAV